MRKWKFNYLICKMNTDTQRLLLPQVVIGQRIRLARNQRGLKQKELAKMINVSPAMMCRIESGTIKIAADTCFAIAIILEIPERQFNPFVEIKSYWSKAKLPIKLANFS